MPDRQPASNAAAPNTVAPKQGEQLHTFRYRDYSVEDYVVLIVFWALAAVVFTQFFSRYVLNSSVTWTEEIAGYLLIFVGFAGSIMGVRRNSHIFVEACYRFMPRKMGLVSARLADIVKIVFFAVGTWLSWRIIPIMAGHRMVSVNLPMSWIYIAVFISFLIMTLRSTYLAYRNFKAGFIPFGG